MNTGVSSGSAHRLVADEDDAEIAHSNFEPSAGQVGALLDDLPASVRLDIMNVLQSDEKLLHVEQPSWLRTINLPFKYHFYQNKSILTCSVVGLCLTFRVPVHLEANLTLFVAGMTGTILLIILVSVGIRNLNVYIFLGAFPLALIGSIFSCLKSSTRFIVFTDRRCIAKPGIGSPAIIPYSKITNVQASWNYLFCLKEIEVKRKVIAQAKGRQKGTVESSKSEFLDAIPNIDYYCSFLQRMQAEASSKPAETAVTDV